MLVYGSFVGGGLKKRERGGEHIGHEVGSSGKNFWRHPYSRHRERRGGRARKTNLRGDPRGVRPYQKGGYFFPKGGLSASKRRGDPRVRAGSFSKKKKN